jgi:Protein of unknown function (DUF3106)
MCWTIWERRRGRRIRNHVRKSKSITILAVGALLLAISAGPCALAQNQGKWNQGKWNNRNMEAARPRGYPQGPGPHRGEWLRNNQHLPPAEQERALRNDPAFRQLPPDRQQRLVERLHDFNSRSPEERQRILDRMETFEHLPQPQRQQVRNLYGQMRELPQDRRMAVNQAARQLSGMSPAERERMLNSPQFRRRFSPQEQDLVRGFAQLEPAPR